MNSLLSEKQYDIAVIGAGIAGSYCADRLQAADLQFVSSIKVEALVEEPQASISLMEMLQLILILQPISMLARRQAVS